MTPQEHMELMGRERSGDILLGVEPAAARRLFTDMSNALSRELLGESLAWQRCTVFSFWLLGFLAILASVGAAVWAFGWWAILVAAGSVSAWGFFMARSSMSSPRIVPIASFFLLAVVFCILPGANVPFQVWLALVAGAFFLSRLTYAAAVALVRGLVRHSHGAFEKLHGRVVFVREARSE